MDRLSVTRIQALLSEASADELPTLLAAHCNDPRSSVTAALLRATRRLDRDRTERARLESLAACEWALADRGVIVAGVDEVGRGALAGPVSAGACVLPRDAMLPGLDDSKRLTAIARERLHDQIRRTAVSVSVGHAQPAEIDALGITRAIVLAMRRALAGLGIDVGHVLVDGRQVELGVPSTAIVKGDSSVRAIAAAAVYAKVERDRIMTTLAEEYPAYGFAHNKGYGSSGHLEALAALGPAPVHRASFSPCSQHPLF
ncbi:MAG: ribonuclease HII [Coriobacteriia bacterium]